MEGGRGPEDRGGRGRQHPHPELVQGFATREDRLPVDELVLFDIDAERLGVVAGLAGRMLARAGWGGRLVQTGRREQAIDGADFVVVQLGSAARPCAWWTRPCRWSSAASARRRRAGRLRQGPAHRRSCSSPPRRCVAPPAHGFVDFTNPVGIVTQACWTGGGPSDCATRPSGSSGASPPNWRWPRAGRARARRPQPPHLGACRQGGRGGPAAGAAGRHGPGWPATWPCWSCSRPSGSSPRPTSGTTTPPPRCSTSSGAAPRAPSRWPRSSGACSSCTATPGSTPSPSCWSGAAGPSTARPRPAIASLAGTGDVRGGRRPQRRGPARPARRRRGRGPGASTPTARTRCPSTRSAPRPGAAGQGLRAPAVEAR